MSRILSRISMLTGQISSHARQVVQAHSSSEVMRSNSELADTVMPASVCSGGDTTGLPVAAITSPVLSTISRGSSGLPVACAGQTLVQRPHIVQASVSSSCFQVNPRPPRRRSSARSRRGSASASSHPSTGLVLRYMLSGDVNMWRSIVTGRITRKAQNATTCTIQFHWCSVCKVVTDRPSTSVLSG